METDAKAALGEAQEILHRAVGRAIELSGFKGTTKLTESANLGLQELTEIEITTMEPAQD